MIPITPRLALFAATLCLTLSAQAKDIAAWKTDTATFRLGESGELTAIESGTTNYLAPKQPAPVLRVRVAGKDYAPDGASWDAANGRLTLSYSAVKATVVVKVAVKPKHITLEVVEALPREKIEMIRWGAYPTILNRTIGELVGVVRGVDFGVGIQVLNPKTMGGFPIQDNDIMPYASAKDQNQYDQPWVKTGTSQRFWSNTATRTAFGSVLQAYCRDRSQDRQMSLSIFGFKKAVAPAYKDGGIIGSAIALFACPKPVILDTLEAIELAEKLPHTTAPDGQWTKRNPSGPTAIIIDFSEKDFDHALALAKQSGVDFVYSRALLNTWGNWEINPQKFPHGWDGLKACVERAEKQGVGVGLHTLSFISAKPVNYYTCTNDKYVTSGDARLATVGSTALTAPLDATATSISIADPTLFRTKPMMNAVRIGSELVHFRSVSAKAPWQLLNCTRGEWGSKATAHDAGSEVARLTTHEWHCVLPNSELSVEMAQNLAKLCNHAGIRLLGIDGLEGMWATGLGQYGRALYVNSWHNALKPELKNHVYNEASNASPFNWHINTHFSWGEFDGFSRTSKMAKYRVIQQAFYIRNYIPRNLGFYVVKPKDTVADIEFMLAQSAGYDAGFGLELNDYTRGKNLGPVLDAAHTWLAARRANAFPEELKPMLQSIHNSFHLEVDGKAHWKLYPVVDGVRGAPLRLPVSQPLDKKTLDRFDATLVRTVHKVQ